MIVNRKPFREEKFVCVCVCVCVCFSILVKRNQVENVEEAEI